MHHKDEPLGPLLNKGHIGTKLKRKNLKSDDGINPSLFEKKNLKIFFEKKFN